MNAVVFDQGARLASFLPDFQRRNVARQDGPIRTETVRVRVAERGPPLDQADLSFLFGYHIFPPEILRFRAEWEEECRAMRVGDTIVQQAEVPPGHGFHLIFGVRVTSVFCEAGCAGFRYRTLAGHPECGDNEFRFERRGDTVLAFVHTETTFASWLARLFAPVFTRRYVRYCNRRAVECMAREFRTHNAATAAGPSRPRWTDV